MLIFVSKKTGCANQIDDLCNYIEKTIKQTIQNALNTLEKDSDMLIEMVNDTLNKDR